MGDYSDFFAMRGNNKKTLLVVKYISGTKEVLEFKSYKSALKTKEKLNNMNTVSSVQIKIARTK